MYRWRKIRKKGQRSFEGEELGEGKNRRDSKGEEVKVLMERKDLKVKLLCLLEGFILI